MSQSSDDDSNPCEDERQSNQQHTDYYATLNVQRDVSEYLRFLIKYLNLIINNIQY